MDSEKKQFQFPFLSNFVIKLIAIITMTIDHIGVVMQMVIGNNYDIAHYFRIIGRIAMPLFVFMIVEGVLHTKNFRRYMLRLGILASIISFSMIVVEYVPIFDGLSLRGFGNIFIDLLLCALTVFCLKHKKIYIKLLAVIPLGISILSFSANCYEFGNNAIVHWYPFFIRGQYEYLPIIMSIFFYFAHYLKDITLKTNERLTGLKAENIDGTNISQIILNIWSIGGLILAGMIYYLVGIILPNRMVYWDNQLQTYSLLASLFILLYNGKRGYNKKWFQLGSYIYYPLHILIIYGIGLLFM